MVKKKSKDIETTKTKKSKKPKPKKRASTLKFPRLPKEKVRAGLQRSGFPLELHIREILRKAGWSVRTQEPYLDEILETGAKIERTIDIKATKRHNPKSHRIDSLEMILLIECKQQENSAWVFDKGAKRVVDWDNPHEASFYCDDSYLSQFGDRRWNEIIKVVGQASHQAPEMISAMALSGTTYRESKKQKMENEPDLLHKGSQQIIKALEYMNESLAKSGETAAKDHVQNQVPLFWRAYPVLAFRGSMFNTTLDEGALQLEDTKYVHLHTKTTRRSYMIDVVRSDFFEKYLEEVESEFQLLCKLLDGIVWKKRE